MALEKLKKVPGWYHTPFSLGQLPARIPVPNIMNLGAIMRKWNASILILILVAVWCSPAIAGPANDINKEIKKRGLSWVAKDNEVARLHRELGWYSGGPLQSHNLGDVGVFESKGTKELPAKLDWRDMDGVNYVTPVGNQRDCGGCWAFATTAPIESAIAIAEDWPDPKINLSEQMLISCSNAGSCENGGLTNSSFEFAKVTGLPSEDCFPFTAKDPAEGEVCENKCEDWRDDIFKIDDWRAVTLTGFNVQAMKEALLEGPLAVSMVVYTDFHYYDSGVYQNTVWEISALHAVTIVGWDDANDCWIVKNSWGPYWGEDGFFRIKIGNSFIGAMSILPTYYSQGLGPEPDDDDDDQSDDDDDEDSGGDDDDDTPAVPPPTGNKDNDDEEKEDNCG